MKKLDSFQVIQNTVRLLRVISEPGGHIVLSGESGNCRQSMVKESSSLSLIEHIEQMPISTNDQVRLAAFIYDMKLSILDNNDITNESSWRRILRSVVR